MGDKKRQIHGHSIRRTTTQSDRLAQHGFFGTPPGQNPEESGVEGVSDQQIGQSSASNQSEGSLQA